MNFPPASPQLPTPALPEYRPVGAVTLTADLQSAATALVSKLAGGCIATVFDECSTFQQAYVNAGGSLTIDGLYGPTTAAALQSVLTTMNGSTAPQACVTGVASGSVVPALSPTVPAPSSNPIAAFFAPGATVNIPLVGAVQTQTLLIGAASLFALWIVGSSLWKAVKEGGHGIHESKTERARPARRRRNPTRKRRVREKARERVKGQGRDTKTGRFKK